jgi:hypothetical protein
LARRLNPILPAIRAANYGGYYWVLDQAEIATDVMFDTRSKLLELWPDLVRHAALNMSSEDVLGFLGRKLHSSLAAEVVTDTKRRPNGWRVRHRMAGNWVKVYDKASVLRVETVINNPREFRVLRVFTDEAGRRERRWCPMRKGVCDLWRTFQVGIGANQRYLAALAAAPLKGEGFAALDTLCRPRTNRGRRVARFSPLNPADRADVLHQGIGAAGAAHGGDHRGGVGRGPRRDGPGADAGQHPAAQQVGLLLTEPQRQTRQVILDAAAGEPLHRPRPRILRVTDRGGQRDELFELTSLGPRRVFGSALDEDPLTRDRIGGHDPVAGLARRGGVDAGAVLELGERLLAIPTGHDRKPPP